MTDIAQPMTVDGPKGIGGWLILPLIGLVITPLRGLVTLPATYGGLGEAMPYLSSGQAAFVYAEAAFNAVVLIVLPLVLLVLLFQKKRAFARWFVIWAIVGIVGLVIDLIIAKYMFPDAFPTLEAVFDAATLQELLRSIVMLCVWVPYMLISKRVKNTFVN